MRTAEYRGVAWAFWAHAESLRVAHDLTTAELCRRANVRRQTYGELQRTTRRPQRYIVLAIAGTLAMDTDHALALAGLIPTDADTVRLAIVGAHDLNDVQKDSLLALLDHYESQERGEPHRISRTPSGRRVLFQAPADRSAAVA